jgi:integrase
MENVAAHSWQIHRANEDVFKVRPGFQLINPARPIATPKVADSEAVPFTEEQVETILTGCDSYDGDGRGLKAPSLLLLWSGLRIGDASTIGQQKIIKDDLGWKV